ncbi:hypothetical protein [Amphritea balenae]|nr:hypothetical protein [Amphritea balenae]GGK57612.1 hypothetical protein GCM10007941_04730 [Amphritea balenae]
MSHDEQGVEMIGVVPSILMVVGGLAVAILPLLVQIGLLMSA